MCHGAHGSTAGCRSGFHDNGDFLFRTGEEMKDVDELLWFKSHGIPLSEHLNSRQMDVHRPKIWITMVIHRLTGFDSQMMIDFDRF